jgi:hypothetical protein
MLRRSSALAVAEVTSFTAAAIFLELTGMAYFQPLVALEDPMAVMLGTLPRPPGAFSVYAQNNSTDM